MNEWVVRSLEIANAPGYLDKLSAIYRPTRPPRRPLPNAVKRKIRQLHRAGDLRALVAFFFALRRQGYSFPFEHPYASLLHARRELIKKNNQVVDQIGRALLDVSASELIRGCERPADINRVMGSHFQDWIRNYFPQRGFYVLPENKFENACQPSFLDAVNAAILAYVRDKLGYDFSLGRDFLAKVGRVYIMGEARFFSTHGGSQTRDLRSTLEFAKSARMNLTTVAVVDGIVWFNRR